MNETTVRKEKRLIIHTAMRQDIGKRQRQEDAMIVSPPALSAQKGILAILADGMGGMSNGDVFSGIAVHEMMNAFEEKPYNENMCATLLECYGFAQEKALAAQNSDEEGEGGATVTAVLIRNGKCAFLSVGDSRICLLRGGGLIQLNREHVFGTALDERAALGVITREEAQLHLERKALTNFLGRKTTLLCDICSSPFILLPSDKLLLMSDGVFGTLDDQRIVELAMLPHPQSAEAIIEAVIAEKKPKQDNCSILLISIE